MKYPINQKIYYTGDMANHPGWFKITEQRQAGDYNPNMYTLTEIDGDRTFKAVFEIGIADIYEGRGGQRFVTAEAHEEYWEKQMQQLNAWINRDRATV